MFRKHKNLLRRRELFENLYKKFHNSIRNKSRKVLKAFSKLNRRESSVFPFTRSEREVTSNVVIAKFSTGHEIPIEVPTERYIKSLLKKTSMQGRVDSNAFYLFLLT